MTAFLARLWGLGGGLAASGSRRRAFGGAEDDPGERVRAIEASTLSVWLNC